MVYPSAFENGILLVIGSSKSRSYWSDPCAKGCDRLEIFTERYVSPGASTQPVCAGSVYAVHAPNGYPSCGDSLLFFFSDNPGGYSRVDLMRLT